MTDWREQWDDEAAKALLATQRLDRTGMEVKLDKGFEPGSYGVTVEYGVAARQVGFAVARKQALAYAGLLKKQLDNLDGHSLGGTDDSSRDAGPQRKYDLESAFLTFDLTTDDGNWHDDAMTQRFRTALLRADQQWDQTQAGVDALRRAGRQETFRRRLDALLDGESYRHVDAATKERLHAEVMALVFPPRGRGL